MACMVVYGCGCLFMDVGAGILVCSTIVNRMIAKKRAKKRACGMGSWQVAYFNPA